MNIITKYNIDNIFSKIKIKKPIYFNNKTILNIHYGNQNCLLLQTPIMYLPYDFIEDNKMIKCLDLCEYNNEQFINFIILLYKKIINRIKRFDNNIFDKKVFYSNIVKNKKNDKISMIRFRDNYISKIKIYDIYNNIIEKTKIVKETKVKCIMLIKNVWINEHYYGFNIELLQIQNREFINNNSLFASCTNINNLQTINNQVNMITSPPPPGITSLPPPPPAPPPPPPPPPIINTSKKKSLIDIINNNKKNSNSKGKIKDKTSMSDVVKQINSGAIKLKKTVINENRKKDPLMDEMTQILRRRMRLIDGQ